MRNVPTLSLTACVEETAEDGVIPYGDYATIWREVGRGSGRSVLIGV
jgi:hypothetical protein